MIKVDSKYSDRLDKIDRYIMKFADDVNFSAVSASRYYVVCGKIIRVSDHIGNHSDGIYHIIVKPNGYLIHHPNSGTINIVTYEQVKEFIRVFLLFPIPQGPVAPISAISERLVSEEEDIEVVNRNNYILGIPKNLFTEGQLQGIMTMVGKVLRDAKK